MGRRILITTSTFPAHDDDPVPSFIRDYVVAIKQYDPTLRIAVLAPHDSRSHTKSFTRHKEYDEYRYRYMWPARLERLSGQGGIMPSIKKHKWLILIVPFFLIAQTLATIRTARETKADIIHANWLIPQGIAAVIASSILSRPVIVSTHGSDVLSLNNPALNLLKRFVIKAASMVTANSSSSYDSLKKIVFSRSYPIIPMGATIGQFTPHAPMHDPIRILFIGRLSEEKGVDDLLSMLVQLKKSGQPFVAKIAGSGPKEEDLKKQSEKEDLEHDVEFVGWVDRDSIEKLYDWADIFVGLSKREALGVVFIEAGAHGLPVVATDTGGIPDVVFNGTTGFTVPVGSPQKAADAVHDLATNTTLYKAMGLAAHAHISAIFSWESIAARYCKLYDEIDKAS